MYFTIKITSVLHCHKGDIMYIYLQPMKGFSNKKLEEIKQVYIFEDQRGKRLEILIQTYYPDLGNTEGGVYVIFYDFKSLFENQK